MRELELYVHIPFCVQKCRYCDFLSATASHSEVLSYVDRLKKEIRALAPAYAAYQVSSVYIGGGTPSLLEPSQITDLMDSLSENFRITGDAEVSMECNPGTLTRGKAVVMRQSGINRISLGLQSVHDAELKLLGRIHSYADFLKSFRAAREAGFSNINTDLIFGLPEQKIDSWEETLTRVAELCPEHISAYGLMVEAGTPFYACFHTDDALRGEGAVPLLLPTEEEERRMYGRAEEILSSHGYGHYEISNYAKTGRACRHNIGYWTGREYLGLGLGASSLIEDIRFQNTSVLKEYMEEPFARRREERLGQKERMEEFMFLGLRMMGGVSKIEFQNRFGTEPERVYATSLDRLSKDGLLRLSGDRISLTPRGVDVSNIVLEKFLL